MLGQRIQLTLIDFTSDARYRVDSGAAGGGGHESPGAPPASAASAVDAAVQPDFCYRYAQVCYSTAGVGKRVRSTGLYHFRQCCVVLKPRSDRTNNTVVVSFMTHDCS